MLVTPNIGQLVNMTCDAWHIKPSQLLGNGKNQHVQAAKTFMVQMLRMAGHSNDEIAGWLRPVFALGCASPRSEAKRLHARLARYSLHYRMQQQQREALK